MQMPLILCYHGISDRWPARLSIAPDRLRAHLRMLLRRGWRAERFSEAVLASNSRRTLSVTFDDAYRSVLTDALPVLQELGIPGTLFVPTAHVGGRPMSWLGIDNWFGGPHESELIGCTWEEIRALAHAGWEIGSHTLTHPHLTAVSDRELEHELRESKAECEAELGTECRSLSYPYGDHDDRVVEAVRQAGYVVAGTLPGRIDTFDPLRYPRIYVDRMDGLGRFAAKTSPALLRIRRSRLWDVVRAGSEPTGIHS